ncbi:MAG: hypothetical protein ABIQ58_01495 [Candidatus Limnocylindrales bacterium]
MADEGMLRRRLEAYAETRLSPDPAASSRIRARVLAVAHRQSALVRADTTLALLSEPHLQTAVAHERAAQRGGRPTGRSVHLGAWRRAASVLMAATLGLSVMAGTALAARPGGALYGARIWAETLTLPTEPSARAVAELERLHDRLTEATAASAARDDAAAAAALLAYEGIVAEATDHAVGAGDEVAAAALEVGFANSVTVLQALIGTVPAQAGEAIARAIDRAIDRAIERSNDALDAIGDVNAGGGSGGNGSGGNGDGGNGDGGQPTTAPTPRPTKESKPTSAPGPAATQQATPTSEPTGTVKPTPDPTKTPKPSKAPVEPGAGSGRPGSPPKPSAHPTPPG